MKDYIYNKILETDHNVSSSVLTFGPLLFEYIKKDNSFNIKRFILEAEKYMLYSAENICKTYEWLKSNNFIYYSKVDNKYYASRNIK